MYLILRIKGHQNKNLINVEKQSEEERDVFTQIARLGVQDTERIRNENMELVKDNINNIGDFDPKTITILEKGKEPTSAKIINYRPKRNKLLIGKVKNDDKLSTQTSIKQQI